MTPSVSTSVDVLAVTATICRLVPSAMVWRDPDITCSVPACITVRWTEAGKRTATQTVTDCLVTCRSTGPARTWGRLFRRKASVVQAILLPAGRSGPPPGSGGVALLVWRIVSVEGPARVRHMEDIGNRRGN